MIRFKERFKKLFQVGSKETTKKITFGGNKELKKYTFKVFREKTFQLMVED
jgi:hypothetical protein